MLNRTCVTTVAVAFSLLLAGCGGGEAGAASAAPSATGGVTASVAATAGLSLSVRGNSLVDAAGNAVRLVGINRMGGGCIRSGTQASDIDGPIDAASVTELAQWHVNAVRITINEDCWLGINGAPAEYAGANYRNAIAGYVQLLNSHGYYVIVDLHTVAPGGQLSAVEQAMPDADHAITYWQSLASTFAHDPAVVFEPYNEPQVTTKNAATFDPWSCWLSGCMATSYVPGPHHAPVPEQWQMVGMQQLVDTIRATGATNVITLSGLSFASDLSGLLAHLPHDPDHQLAATFHNYGRSATQNGGCGPACWDTVIAGVASSMPVITDELGEPDCQTSYVSQYMSWADAHGVSYLPWGWATWGCANHGYGLLSSWDGTPNSYGRVFLEHFAQVAGAAS